jgi:general secretion pathway protein G
MIKAPLSRRSIGALRRAQKGMTLLEIMIVIAILGLLASVVVVAVMNQFENSKVKTTKIKMGTIKTALSQYKVNHGEYPGGDGLKKLLNPPEGMKAYLKGKSTPKDDFGNPIIYKANSGSNGAPFELISKGPDGQIGTDDDIKITGP